ncbi:DUF4265 domain-containing protein [Undibacterium sp. Tian12W]|uniref:DUF4265 domain-containing protein n=1 Tax=Undibacterium sp. Tian12W TaxID=3413054 RepID=UPI003BEFBA85
MTAKADDLYRTHQSPVWRAEANFLIMARVDDDGESQKWEQLWTKKIDAYKFVICCIPFFTWDMDLGDEVETTNDYVFSRVLRPSGYKTHRIWFGNSLGTDTGEVAQTLQNLGAEVEWSSRNLLAVSAASKEINGNVLKYLSHQHSQQCLIYESIRP